MAATHDGKPRTRSAEEDAVVQRLMALPARKQVRIAELCQLFQSVADSNERQEIAETLAEVLFRGASQTNAVPISSSVSDDARAKLHNHRMYVAQQIKRTRVKMGMTQKMLAAKASLPQPHISRLERGEHAPTYFTIEKLAKALRVLPGDLDPSFD